MDVSMWLQGLGLENYAHAFQAHDIDAEVLPRLTADDLIALGVTSIGHRRKLLNAIAALDQGRAPAATEPIAVAARALEPERRQLTVLFCDLVGSTELAARLDPEDLRGIMAAYQRCAATVVERFEGHIAKYLGDGVLAYFGWPQAHEDDAERAVRAGLALVEEIARLQLQAAVSLQARVGIATGLVVVGDLIGAAEAQERGVVGDTPNLAARLQALAAPGNVVIGAATRRLVVGLFELDDLGPQRLKGFSEPLTAWRVSRQSLAEGRFEARHTAGLTPLVGREEEIGLLLRRWQQARDSEGQAVLLSGEPGIGKSRIVREMHARFEGEPHVRLLYQCSPHHMTSPLHPVIEQLERAAGFERDDPPEARLDKLEGLLARGTDQLDEAAPLVATLVGLPIEGRYPPLDLTPQRHKQRTLEVLVDQLEDLAGAQPVLVTYEDVHWIDPTTQELLGLTIERIQHLPVLAIVTFRPDFMPPWSKQPHVSALALTRLGRRDGSAMVDRVVGNKALPAEVSAQIVAKTDGVPLFLEELTKTVLESGLLRDAGDCYELAGPLPPLAIPSTLHDSLLARLDRLAPVKEVAQTAAVIGRESNHALLAAVSPLAEDKLREAIDQLVASELIFRRGAPPGAIYSFKHALVQDAAYQSLLKSKRQQLHGRIAAVTEERFPETANTQPELVAHHYTEAGATERAVAYWLKAGQRAARQSAHPEAIAHLRRGLDMLDGVPETPERAKQELAFQGTLGPVIMATQGYASPEAGQIYIRARELCQLVGKTEDIYPVLFGVWQFKSVRAHHQEATEVAEELLERTQHVEDPAPRIAGHVALGISLVHTGLQGLARQHFEQAIALHNIEQHLPLAFRYSFELGTIANAYCAWSLWLLGYPDQALERGRHSLALLERIKHPYTEARALYWNAVPHHFRREWPVVEKMAAGAMRSAAEHGFALVRAAGQIMLGAALAARAQVTGGSQQFREGLEAYGSTGARFQRTYFLAMLAEALGTEGLPEHGLEALEDALDLAEESGERFYEAEIHRLKGELMLAMCGQHSAEAEACFHQALRVARQQQAKSLELRAATSLARLWRNQGQHEEARKLLAPVYGWFTEGFDTADLKDAKALLDELA